MKRLLTYFFLFLQLVCSVTIHSQSSNATITGFTYTTDDSTAVIDHLVRLKYASNGQQIDSTYTNGSNTWQFVNVPTPVENENPNMPHGFKLYQNYPNPFNPHTIIRYNLKESSPVNLKIFSINGEEIANLVSSEQPAGQHEVVWDGRNNFGQQVAEGVYLYYLNAGKFNEAKKMIYLHGSVAPSGITGAMPKENMGSNPLQKPGSADYLVEIVNLSGTNPQVINTEHFFTLSNDTSFNVYAPRQGSPVANIDLTSLVQMLSGNVPGKYETAQLKQNGNVIQTKNTGETGTAQFENVPKNQSYTIHFFGDTASRPNINAGDFPIFLDGDTAIVVNPELYLRPTVLANLENKIFKEDEYPNEPRMHDLWTKATGYDSLGNQVNPSALIYLIQNQSNPNLAPVIIDANQYTKLQSLLPDGNGTNNVTVRTIAPNSLYADKGFNVIVNAMPDRKGQLKDTEGNARQGYIYARNAAGQQFIMQTNADGTFAYQLNPSAWDSLKGQIQNDVRPNEGGFIRALYFTTNNDQNNINVDAVPHLNGNDYIGLDTLDSFIKEANFNAPTFPNTLGKLKKADLDNMLDFISSWTTFYQDTIKPEEQAYIRNIIEQRIDPYFDIPSTKWSVPQDSGMSSVRNNAINWFKDKEGPLGGIITWDDNNDGILEKAAIRLSYIRNIIGQDTTYNNFGLVQEGLSARVAPGEVGIVSPIDPAKTILHKDSNAPGSMLQPADIWLVNIAKNYPALTEHDAILKIGNFATLYNNAIKNAGKGPLVVVNKYANVRN